MIILPVEKRFDWQRAPVALLLIILVNIVVFYLYQSYDQIRQYQAIGSYLSSGYLNKEWPLYKDYLQDHKNTARLEDVNALYHEKDYGSVAFSILADQKFYRYLERSGPDLFYAEFYENWSSNRPAIQQQMDSVSSLRFGLKPDNLSVIDLFTHQFLHGGFMHLAGNMVFLLICGFVVEAALGHVNFLLFYLAGGVAAGLAQVASDPTSGIPLIGASGAISAVMAMYLVLFRWREIEFFYWFYLLVGYFRAPALVILPIYIAKEIYSFYFDPDSNVAFMAHAGGFVAGAVLVGIAAIVKPSILNTEYLDQSDNDVDVQRQKLADIYDALEKYHFDHAFRLLQESIREYGKQFELLLLRCNLLKIAKGDKYKVGLNELLSLPNLSVDEASLLDKVWRDNKNLAEQLSLDTLFRCGQSLTMLDNLDSAEGIFRILRERNAEQQKLKALAHTLSAAYARLNQADMHRKYERLADGSEYMNDSRTAGI